MSAHRAVTVRSDALERALRTLWVAVGVDIVTAIGVGLTTLMTQFEVTSGAFWTGLGVLTLKSVLTAVASYFVRLKVTPKNTA